MNVKTLEELDDLFKYQYDGAVSDLFVEDVLETSCNNDILRLLIAKVKHGGKISLIGNEFYEIVRDCFSRYMTYEETQKKLYGENGEKKRCYSMAEVCNMLVDAGFIILKRRCNNYQFFIEAIRQ